MAFDINDARDHWRRKKAAIQEATNKGLVIITFQDRRMQVAVPMTDEFKDFANSIEGSRYRPRTSRWSFPRYESKAVLEALRAIYGKDSLRYR